MLRDKPYQCYNGLRPPGYKLCTIDITQLLPTCYDPPPHAFNMSRQNYLHAINRLCRPMLHAINIGRPTECNNRTINILSLSLPYAINVLCPPPFAITVLHYGRVPNNYDQSVNNVLLIKLSIRLLYVMSPSQRMVRI